MSDDEIPLAPFDDEPTKIFYVKHHTNKKVARCTLAIVLLLLFIQLGIFVGAYVIYMYERDFIAEKIEQGDALLTQASEFLQHWNAVREQIMPYIGNFDNLTVEFKDKLDAVNVWEIKETVYRIEDTLDRINMALDKFP